MCTEAPVHHCSLRWRLVKPWLGVAGLIGAGFLPCPDCGAPLLWHFWPVAAVLALRNWTKQKKALRLADFSEDDVSLTQPGATDNTL